MPSPVSSIPNLGPASEAAFARAGIHSAEDIREMGADAQARVLREMDALTAKREKSKADAEAGATLLRVLILLGAFALLSISPTVYLWRVGVLGTLATLVWAFFLIHEQTARHWFMHRLTLQDAFDNARGRFGGPHDVDSLCLMTINAGVPIQPDDLIAGEVDLADALVEQAHAAEVEARMHQATPPTDTAH